MLTILKLINRPADKKLMATNRLYHWIRGCSATFLVPALLMTLGCNGKIPGLANFRVGVAQSRLNVAFVSTQLHWDFGITVPLPGLYDSTVGVNPDVATGGVAFQFSISIQALLNNGQPLPLSTLPDGRPIPDIEGGALPRWDTTVHDVTLSLYLSDEAFGLFIPLTLRTKKGYSLPWTISLDIRDERGNLLGKAYAIPENDNETGSGLFILLPYLGGAPAKQSP